MDLPGEMIFNPFDGEADVIQAEPLLEEVQELLSASIAFLTGDPDLSNEAVKPIEEAFDRDRRERFLWGRFPWERFLAA